ncbi:MAG TPA: DUF3095 domain-containing protein [Turneriella sp.]|nr:DUF3095 domain-containing protein [Turneriella sp.]
MDVNADNTRFYLDLTPAPSLVEALSGEYTQALPKNWCIVITDIVGSTKAIEEGRYKDVNTAGGLAAMALSNVFKTLEFPFIFGGDGATFLIPNEVRETTESVLIDTAYKVKEFFDLELRVGIVPEDVIRKAGYEVRVGKITVSPYYTQAVILGDGVEYAEKLVKHDTAFDVTAHDSNGIKANFFGFSCRWHDVPSVQGETVALILRFNAAKETDRVRHLNEALASIEKFYGSEAEYHPIREEAMQFAYSKKVLWREAAARVQKKRGIRFLLLRWQIFVEISVAWLAHTLSIPLKIYHYRLNKIKWYNRVSSDYKKFDGMLKMVLSGTPEARAGLQRYFERWLREGRINYGIHVSNRAILTCLLHTGTAQEVHFVDAADGGYAMAAKMLKKQLG